MVQSLGDEENSASDKLEVVETTPQDPRDPTPTQTQELEYNSPPSPTRQVRSTRSTPKAARVVVIPKKHLIVVQTREAEEFEKDSTRHTYNNNNNNTNWHSANNNNTDDFDGDDAMDESYEDNAADEHSHDEHMSEGDEDVDIEALDADFAQENYEPTPDPLSFLDDEYYTRPPLRSKGKGTLGKRAKGKAYNAGGKAPRAPSGRGKAPRAPSGAGKAPAVSPREKRDQEQRVKFLNELPNNNNAAKAKPKKKKKNNELGLMPVGKKPENNDAPAKKKKKLEKWHKEVILYQRSGKLLIPKRSFQNLVREIVHVRLMENYKWARTSLEALQWATEDWVSEHLDLTNLCTIHAKRSTAMVSDSQLVRVIRGKMSHVKDSIVPALPPPPL